MYSTTQLRQIFNVTRQTIGVWCKEFAQYLSPNANPTDGSRRSLNDDDLQILALISDMTAEGKTYEAVHLALASGQRGRVLLDHERAVIPAELRLKSYNKRIDDLEERLREVELGRAEALGQVTQANYEIAALKKEVRQLYREIFEWENNGTAAPND